MKRTMLIILTIGVALASAADCHITCPEGYHGGCVKSGEDCDCSCWKNARDAKDAIINALERMNASSELRGQARKYLASVDELPETTLTDKESRKQFTISLKTF